MIIIIWLFTKKTIEMQLVYSSLSLNINLYTPEKSELTFQNKFAYMQINIIIVES